MQENGIACKLWTTKMDELSNVFWEQQEGNEFTERKLLEASKRKRNTKFGWIDVDIYFLAQKYLYHILFISVYILGYTI